MGQGLVPILEAPHSLGPNLIGQPNYSLGQIVMCTPSDVGPKWLEDSYANHQIGAWIDAVKHVHDVFLAYSSTTLTTAGGEGVGDDLLAFVLSLAWRQVAYDTYRGQIL